MPECSLVQNLIPCFLTFCSTIEFNSYLPFEFLILYNCNYYVVKICKIFITNVIVHKCIYDYKNNYKMLTFCSLPYVSMYVCSVCMYLCMHGYFYPATGKATDSTVSKISGDFAIYVCTMYVTRHA